MIPKIAINKIKYFSYLLYSLILTYFMLQFAEKTYHGTVSKSYQTNTYGDNAQTGGTKNISKQFIQYVCTFIL